jgi:peptide/nickel transport system substrate-binding protein
MKKINTLLLALSLTLLLVLAGTGVAADDEAVLRYAMGTAPSGVFNPAFITNNYDRQIAHVTYEKLVDLMPSLEYEGELATDWSVSDDNRTLTFNLREGVKWHDGEDFTADDVRFTFEFMAHPDYSGSLFSNIAEIEGIQEYKDGTADSISGIEVVDDYTIKITTSNVFAAFLYEIAGQFIIPEHIWSTVSVADAANATDMLRAAIGTGPFKMSEYAPDQYVELVKNEDYWGGTPQIDRFIFVVVNPETQQMQLTGGEIDFLTTTDLNPDTMKFYEDSGMQIHTTLIYNGAYQVIEVNNQHPILGNKYVRQALVTAIDRESIVEFIMNGYAVVADTAYPPSSWAYPEGLNKYPYSPENAIDLLVNEAGWEYTDGTMYADGEAVKFELLYNGDNPIRAQIAPLVQEYWKEIGVELEITSMEFSTLLDFEATGDYELAMIGNGGGVDPSSVSNELASFGGFNTSLYANEVTDEWFREGATYINVEDRQPIYYQIAQQINEDMPYLFLYHWNEAQVYRSDLVGVQPHNLSNFYKVQDWQFEN